jgi:hypothetical protein
MKKNIFCILLLNTCIVFGQSGVDINYQKPSAILPQVAEIMKYTDYPTDLFSGLVNINIPLYILVDGDITLPISISYHASGMKVKEKTGKIGFGWSLNAEPSVSRNIKGTADDSNTGYLKTKINPKSTFAPYYFDEQVTSGAWDLEPDVFYYKLADKSGKFYFMRDVYAVNPVNEIVIHPYEPIIISSNTTSSPITSFDITDESGLRYNFSGAYGTIDNIKTQWLASSIVSPNNRGTVTFSYKAPETIFETYNSKFNPYYIAVEEALHNDNFNEYVFSVSCESLRWPFITEYGEQEDITTRNIIRRNDIEPYTDSNGIYVYESERDENLHNFQCALSYPNSNTPVAKNQYIETINSRAVSITFFYDPNSIDKELIQRIEVKDKLKNEIIRKIYFTQSRYNHDTYASRKKLDEIRITDKNDVLLEKYKFDYKDEFMPPQYSTAADHWGFVNRSSHGYPQTEIPQHNIRVKKIPITNSIGLPEEYVVQIGDANKEANMCAASAILTGITYPTGRKTSFYYENHQYIHDNILVLVR